MLIVLCGACRVLGFALRAYPLETAVQYLAYLINVGGRGIVITSSGTPTSYVRTTPYAIIAVLLALSSIPTA